MIVDGDCAVIAVDARIAGVYCIRVGVYCMYIVFKCTLVYLLQMALSAQLP